MKQETIIERIASLCVQNQNCVKANNVEWRDKSQAELNHIAKNLLPSGSGIDCGTKIDVAGSSDNKVILVCSYHHMNENGMYDGWTEHTITVRPSFVVGLNISISGPDRNAIKEYLHDVYFTNLSEAYETPVLA